METLPKTEPQPDGTDRPELKRVLNWWDAIALSIGIVIGSGIFAVPPLIAGNLDTFGSMISVWVLGGLLALCGALTYAELSTMFPQAGGSYVFLHKTYGPFPAFAYGWSALLITYPASMAAVAVVFTQYLHRWIPMEPGMRSIVAAGICLVVAATNMLGVRLGTGILKVLTFAKVAAISAIPIFGFALLKGDFSNFTAGGITPSGGWSLSIWALAMAGVMWTFEGWADTPTIAGEVRDKKRDIPKGLIVSAVAVTLIYLAVNMAYTYLLSVPGVAQSSSVASDAAAAVFGDAGVFWVTALVLISTAGSLNGMVIAGSRVFYAMSRDGLFLRSMGAVHPKFGTPIWSLAIIGIMGAAYAYVGSFERIMSYFVFNATVWFALNIFAVFVLRKTRKDTPRPFKVPFYPVTPLIFLVVIIGLMIQLFIDNTQDALVGLVLILVCVPFFMIWTRFNRKNMTGV